MRIIPRERWTDFSHEVIWHGRKLCVARSPKCAIAPWKSCVTPPTRLVDG